MQPTKSCRRINERYDFLIKNLNFRNLKKKIDALKDIWIFIIIYDWIFFHFN